MRARLKTYPRECDEAPAALPDVLLRVEDVSVHFHLAFDEEVLAGCHVVAVEEALSNGGVSVAAQAELRHDAGCGGEVSSNAALSFNLDGGCGSQEAGGKDDEGSNCNHVEWNAGVLRLSCWCLCCEVAQN